MASLAEKHRPKTWEDVVGQDKVLKVIERLRAAGTMAGRGVWLSGASGTGKTTIARLYAAELCSEFCVDELDAGQVRESQVPELQKRLATRGLGKPGRAIIMNEAHGLKANVQRALLTALDEVAPHAVWLFTTTTEQQQNLMFESDDATPLLSRCLRLDLARRDLAKPFAERARTIAQGEGLDGQPIERYVRLAQDCRNNLRAMLSAIEAGAMIPKE